MPMSMSRHALLAARGLAISANVCFTRREKKEKRLNMMTRAYKTKNIKNASPAHDS